MVKIEGENLNVEFEYEMESYTANVNVAYYKDEVRGIKVLDDLEIRDCQNDRGIILPNISPEMEEAITDRVKELI